jgi:DNA-binding NarL/FixJ family response regulator
MSSAILLSPSADRRAALRRTLESGGVRVVAEGSPQADGGAWAPAAVVLVDGEQSLEALEEALEEGDATWPAAIVVLSDHRPAQILAIVQRLGAPGWAVLPADAGDIQVLAAVQAAAAGLSVMPADGAHPAPTFPPPGPQADDRAGGDDPDDEEGVVSEALTAREIEVLEWMARGLSNREIGARLGISEHTAKFHVASVLAKLGAQNRADAVRRGVRRGLVTV